MMLQKNLKTTGAHTESTDFILWTFSRPGFCCIFLTVLSCNVQESQSAVLAIDDYVKKVSSISRRWYSDSQLNPQLDRLVQASHQALEIMGELHNSLKCDQLYRSFIFFPFSEELLICDQH